MNLIQRIKFPNGKYYLSIILIAVIIYWPLSFTVFSLKNDAISYFLPWRYHISEAIQNGYFPFWSPYLYTGLPLHADIQSGVWNPVVLTISCFTQYNMNVLQWETLFYIITGGVGAFYLCRFFGFHQKVCLLISIAYICSGFIIDSASFIPWISSAAYLPFVFASYLKTIKTPDLSNALQFGITLFLLFTAGYPSYFIVTGYILLFLTIGQLVNHAYNRQGKLTIKIATYLSISLFLFILFSLPALISFIDFFPYYERGHGLKLEETQINPFHIKNTLSFLFPSASYKLDTGNDISSRNSYFGIIPLIFIVYSFFHKWSITQKTIICTVAILLLFSLGKATPVREFSYHFLPLMNSFRHPGTVRIFTILGLLLLAGFGINKYFQQPDISQVQKITLTFIAVYFICILILLLFTNTITHIQSLFSLRSPKAIVDKLSWADWMLIGAALQLFFLTILFYTIKHSNAIYIAGIINVAVFGWMAMPYTFASQHRSAEVNAFLQSFPKGYLQLPLKERTQDSVDDREAVTVYGYKNFYEKHISIQDYIITPTINNSYYDFLADTALRKFIRSHPFAFTHETAKIELLYFTPNSFLFKVIKNTAGDFYLTQQYNHNWKVFINGNLAKVERDHKAFMKVSVPSGTSIVRFIYRPTLIIFAAFLSIFTLISSTLFIVYKKLT